MKYGLGLLGSIPPEPTTNNTLSTRREKFARDMWNAPSEQARRNLFVQDRRNRFRGRIDGYSDEILYQKFRSFFARAQTNIEHLLGDQFLPHEFRQRVRPLHVPSDPIELMKIGLPISRLKNPQAPLSRHEFEAQRKLELGYTLFFIGLEKFRDPHPGQFEWITEYFKELGIIQTHPRRTTITTYHDHNNELRFCGSNFTGISPCQEDQGHIISLKHRPRKCVIHVGAHADIAISALYSMRHKNPMSIIRKMVATGESLPERVPDIIAMRFVFRETSELRLAARVIAQMLPEGCIYETQDRLETIKRDNPHSASEYRDLSYHTRLVDPQGVSHICEIQLVTLEVISNVEYSAAPSNHRRYELRQLLSSEQNRPPGLFFKILPQYLYGIDWGEKEVRHRIDRYVFERIMKTRR